MEYKKEINKNSYLWSKTAFAIDGTEISVSALANIQFFLSIDFEPALYFFSRGDLSIVGFSHFLFHPPLSLELLCYFLFFPLPQHFLWWFQQSLLNSLLSLLFLFGLEYVFDDVERFFIYELLCRLIRWWFWSKVSFLFWFLLWLGRDFHLADSLSVWFFNVDN